MKPYLDISIKIAYYKGRNSNVSVRRLLEVPGLIKTKEIARRLSEVPGSIKTEEIMRKEHRKVFFSHTWRLQMIECVYIKKEFFEEHDFFEKMMDPGNSEKQAHRSYLFIGILYNNNRFYIPLRHNLGASIRPFGKIGFPVPSASRADAGLDYRYMLIINDDSYIEYPSTQRIPDSQLQILEENHKTIETEATAYISGFVKKAKKGRIEKEAKYRVSSLVNFYSELGI